MPHVPTGNPNGRPPKPIDLQQVFKLAQLGCTIKEIAAFFAVAPSTLTAREGFRSIYEDGLEAGKLSLRRAQMKSALAGNTRLLTWLGMQLLGQQNMSKSELTTPPPPEDLSKLTDEELDAYEKLCAKITPQPGDNGEMPT